MYRRNFVKTLSALFVASNLNINCASTSNDNISKLNFWDDLAAQYKSVRNHKILNLNSGSACVLPDFIFEEYQKINQRFAFEPPYQVWDELQALYKNIKLELATLLNVKDTEVALVRNCTEALNNIIFGIPLQKKDTLIVSKNEYPFVINAIKQRSEREKFKINSINFNLNDSDEKIISVYKKAIDKGAKYLIITYIEFHSGRILPLKPIIDYAHKKGTKVIVDAAHAFGMIQQNLKNLNADYYATSLHKWFNAPLGNGLLFVKENLIEETYALLSNDKNVKNKIVKFEYSGTKPYHNIIGIASALSFLKSIGGIEAKQKRLTALTNYASENLKDINGIKYLSNIKNTAAISAFKFDAIHSSNIKKRLLKEHNIYIKSTKYKQDNYLRLSSNLFLLEKDIDKFTDAIKKILQ